MGLTITPEQIAQLKEEGVDTIGLLQVMICCTDLTTMNQIVERTGVPRPTVERVITKKSDWFTVKPNVDTMRDSPRGPAPHIYKLTTKRKNSLRRAGFIMKDQPTITNDQMAQLRNDGVDSIEEMQVLLCCADSLTTLSRICKRTGVTSGAIHKMLIRKRAWFTVKPNAESVRETIYGPPPNGYTLTSKAKNILLTAGFIVTK